MFNLSLLLKWMALNNASLVVLLLKLSVRLPSKFSLLLVYTLLSSLAGLPLVSLLEITPPKLLTFSSAAAISLTLPIILSTLESWKICRAYLAFSLVPLFKPLLAIPPLFGTKLLNLNPMAPLPLLMMFISSSPSSSVLLVSTSYAPGRTVRGYHLLHLVPRQQVVAVLLLPLLLDPLLDHFLLLLLMIPSTFMTLFSRLSFLLLLLFLLPLLVPLSVLLSFLLTLTFPAISMSLILGLSLSWIRPLLLVAGVIYSLSPIVNVTWFPPKSLLFFLIPLFSTSEFLD